MDRNAYIQAVIKPAWETFTASGELPDYFRRFGLPETVTSQAEIEQAITEVNAHWTGLRPHPRYKPLIDKLSSASELREARETLEDPERRRCERERLEALRGQHRATKLRDLDDSLRMVLPKGYLTPDEFNQVIATYQKRGLSQEDIKGRIKVPVREPETKREAARLSDDRMDQIATHLAVLGNDAVYRNLWTFLRVSAESSRDKIQEAYEAKRKEWEPRPADHCKTSAQILLGYVKTYLIDGDHASYEVARRHRDAGLRLLPQILLAGADGLIDRDQYAMLVELAEQCALPADFAHDYIARVALDRHLGLEVVRDATPRQQCSMCFAFNPQSARHCRNSLCGEPLFTRCPRCSKESQRSEPACPHCGCRIFVYLQVEQLKGHLRSALDARDLMRARELGTEIEQLWGRGDDVLPLLTELDNRLKWIEEQRRKCDAAVAVHALQGAIRLLKGMLAEMPDYAWPDGKSGKTVLKELETTAHATEKYLARARELERQGALNDAASAYMLILANVSDHEDAAAGLRRCPPEAPRGVTSRLSGGNAEITWKPTTSTGEVTYLLVRAEGAPPRYPDEGKLLARTRDLRVIDPKVPSGVLLYYAVFAERAGVASKAADAPPLIETCEIEHLILTAGDGFVQGNWHQPVSGPKVRVFRAIGRPPEPGEGQEIPLATPSSFHDTGMANGQTCGYRVLLEYDGADGATIRTTGVTGKSTPEEPPQAVADLRLAPSQHGLDLTWTPPRRGKVVLYRLEQAPPWRPGTLIAAHEISLLGQPLPASPGASRHAVNLDGCGRYAFLAVTLLGDQALIGEACEHFALDDASGLAAHDFGSFLQLSWCWPELSTQAMVCWREDRAPVGPDDPLADRRRITLGEYQAQGGFKLEAPGQRPYHFVVYAGGIFDSRAIFAPGLAPSCRASLKQRERIAIRYELHASLFNRAKLTIKLTLDEGNADCPELLVVAKRGSDRPVAADDGIVVATLPRRAMEEGTWTEHAVLLGDTPRPVSLRLFFRERAAYDRFRLEEPPAAQMKVK